MRIQHLGFFLIAWLITISAYAENQGKYPQAAEWSQYAYTVLKIIDGDTFVATDGNVRFKVRIVGMDAPEIKQSYGKIAQHSLSTLLLNQKIKIQPVKAGMDMYGRVLGQVYLNGTDVAEAMIKEGRAAYYRPKCRNYPEDKNQYNYDPRPYVEAEKKAKEVKLGIWLLAGFELPCVFRKVH